MPVAIDSDNPNGTPESRYVSGRFLSDLFGALERQGIPARGLLGDLPIRLDEDGNVVGDVDWNHFTDFMRRLERHVGGPAGLEACGAGIGELAPAAALRGLAGLAASPQALYQAATRWALRRALPGIDARVHLLDPGHLEIHTRLTEGLRPCPQILHFATGGARALPRLIGLGEAVVSADITPTSGIHRIIVPPSLTLLARIKRLFRTIYSAGSVLHFLEAQQVELHAKNAALQKAHDALAESEQRYKAITDTAVDVLCEIDAQGRVVYVSRSVEDLVGYTPEQVTGSHFRLWVPRELHAGVDQSFHSLSVLPPGESVQDQTRLHAENGEPVSVEFTARAYDTPDGDRRIVCIIRDASGPKKSPSRNFAPSPLRARPDERRHDAPPVAPAPLDTHAMGSATRYDDDWLPLTPEHADSQRWIETRKLMRSARDMFLAGPTALGLEVEINATEAPLEIWSDEQKLLVGLVRLLDWAAECGASRSLRDTPPSADGPEDRDAATRPSAARRVYLSAGAGDDPTASPAVYLEVALDLPGDDEHSLQGEPEKGRSPHLSAASLKAPGQLSLSLTEEAIAELDAQVVGLETSHDSGRRLLKRIILPQPPRP